ncbi:MAG: hypothetical protein MUC92_02710 [Fimbriimonadaceae bacterium]|nr:hypothetical protein [Fimbriimonadaceae bacterium]
MSQPCETHLTWHEDDPLRLSRVAAAQNLDLTEHPFRTKPAERHWHLKRPRVAGTLEFTWRPQTREFVLIIRRGRRGGWTENAVSDLIEHLEREG